MRAWLPTNAAQGNCWRRSKTCPAFYRPGLNANYYGIKKNLGKRKEHSLGTTDRKIADRRLKEWLTDLEKIDTEVEKMSMSRLLEKFAVINQGKGDKTRATNNSIVATFKTTWKRGLTLMPFGNSNLLPYLSDPRG